MRILIEEYQYNVSDVHDVLYGIDPMENVEDVYKRQSHKHARDYIV